MAFGDSHIQTTENLGKFLSSTINRQQNWENETERLKKAQAEARKFNSSRPEPEEEPIMSDSNNQEPKSSESISGSVILIWSDNSVPQSQIVMEANKFPTKTGFYIADFKDYNSHEEKLDHVEYFQRLIEDYRRTIQQPNGVYRIMVGNIVAKLKNMRVIEF